MARPKKNILLQNPAFVNRAEYTSMVMANAHCEYMSDYHRHHYATDWTVRYVQSIRDPHYVYVVVCRRYIDDLEIYAPDFVWQKARDNFYNIRAGVREGRNAGILRTDPIDPPAPL